MAYTLPYTILHDNKSGTIEFTLYGAKGSSGQSGINQYKGLISSGGVGGPGGIVTAKIKIRGSDLITVERVLGGAFGDGSFGDGGRGGDGAVLKKNGVIIAAVGGGGGGGSAYWDGGVVGTNGYAGGIGGATPQAGAGSNGGAAGTVGEQGIAGGAGGGGANGGGGGGANGGNGGNGGASGLPGHGGGGGNNYIGALLYDIAENSTGTSILDPSNFTYEFIPDSQNFFFMLM
jgi:hypothetical protein